MKYRSRTDIVAQILEAANESDGATKTKIMYKAYLSYAQLKEYLAVLVESGLLQVVENGSTTNNNNNNQTYYRTAEKGWQFLKLYNSIGELANSGSRDGSWASGGNANTPSPEQKVIRYKKN